MNTQKSLNTLSHEQLLEYVLNLSQEKQQLLDFISTWSHDLSSLIGTIGGALTLIETSGMPPESEEAIEVALFGCEMAKNMNLNIMAFNGKEIEVRLQYIELIPWLRPILRLYKTAAKAKKVRLFAPIDDNAPTVFKSDINKLSQIVNNLLSNAVKFSPNDGEVSLRVYTKGVLLFFSVEDQGVGIPSGHLDKIFEPYHRISQKIPGTGLGLTICKRNIEALGGKIFVDSEEGAGTTFTVSLPLFS